MRIDRAYVMLRPVQGEGGGFARLERQQGRCRVTLRACGLPDAPVRAMLIAGEEPGSAVLDLGLMRPLAPGRAALCTKELPWHGGWHTLVLAADWPGAQVLFAGQVKSPAPPLCQAQAAVARYLSLPAPDAPAAPERPTVLHLQARLSP